MKKDWLILIVFIICLTAPFLKAQHAIRFEDLFAMGRIKDPQVSPDGNWIAYTVTSYSLSENSKNSDIFLVSLDGKTTRQLTFSKELDSSPRWFPGGNKLAFLSTRDGSSQIYMIDIDNGEPSKITEIASEVNKFCCSPDGNYFAVATDMFPEANTPEESMDIEERMEKELGSGREIDHLLYRHWNEWREGKYSRILQIDRNGKLIGDLTPNGCDTPPLSLGRKHDFVFSPDSKNLCFVTNQDPVPATSTNNDVWVTTIFSGEIQQISPGSGNDSGPFYSPDGKYIAYLSMARPGFEADQRNLMLYNLRNGKTRNLTEKLDRSISDFVWSPNGNSIYFFVDHLGRHKLFRVDIKSSRLEPIFDNNYIDALRITPDGKYLILARQAVNDPTELYRFDIEKKAFLQLTFTNKKLLSQLEMNSLEEYWFTGARGDSVHLLMLKPPKFDESKKYPMVSLVHGGPQGAWGDDFHYRWNAQMFASPGYVVIMINFHGSRGYGQDFCDAVSGHWGDWPYEDVMTGTRWAIQKFPFIDGDRIGGAGASYGGFMMNWIEGHNTDGLFKCLVSHDGVYEQVSMFGATEEIWFPTWEFNGYPWQKGSLYQKWNPANFVENFNTPMLIIFGENDFRVPYTQGLQLFTALQLQKVDSKLIVFPDEDHFVRKPKNARQWWDNVHAWLEKYLK